MNDILDDEQRKRLLLFGRRELGKGVGLPLRSHLQKLFEVESAEFRACAENNEMLEHYIFKSLDFSRLRLIICSQFSNQKQIGQLEWKNSKNVTKIS